MRPVFLAEFIGQKDLIGEGGFLWKSIKQDIVPSMILWGPPGVGKTTLANIIASETKADFVRLSAVSSGKKNLMEVVERAGINQRLANKTILFIDEIHRWNKAQQDALLPYVESGLVTLIGATTKNPSFHVEGALLSRARVFVLQGLSEEDLIQIVKQALSDIDKGLGRCKVDVSNEVISLIARFANGDARFALNTLEVAVNHDSKVTINLIKQVVQKSHLLYDKDGEEHYNIISALHKSMRGGDVNAAVYWTVRMLEGGEDPLYIARRLVRFASEDVGLADNQALLIANTVFDVCHKLGLPECSVHLIHAVIYLARAKKDTSAYEAYLKAQKDVKEYGNLPVPIHLRNASTKLMKDLGYGKGYKYTPKEDSFNQQYLPDALKDRDYMN